MADKRENKNESPRSKKGIRDKFAIGDGNTVSLADIKVPAVSEVRSTEFVDLMARLIHTYIEEKARRINHVHFTPFELFHRFTLDLHWCASTPS